MIRIILCTILISSTSVFFTGCSLFSGGDKSEPAETTQTESSNFGGLEGDDFGSGDDLFAEESDDFFGGGDEFSAGSSDTSLDAGATDTTAGGDDFGFGSFPDDPVSDTTTATDDFGFGDASTSTTDDFGFGDTSTTTATDDFGFGDTSTTADSGTDPFGASDSSFPGYEDTLTDSSTDYLSSTDTSTSPTTFVEQPSYVPVKKVEAAAFQRGGDQLNRVYIVRPGESLSDISLKIFGSDRSEDIKRWNPYFANSAPKVGDKVYYPSQTQPSDQQMLTYYEEQGMSPQVYISQEGDNIRTLAESWLGHSRSWMEVWATNPNVESKWALPAGVELKYWPTSVSAPIAGASVDSGMATADNTTPGGMGGESDSFDDDMGMDSPDDFSDSVADASPPPADPFDDAPSSDIAMNDSGSDASLSGSGSSLNIPPPPPPPPPPPTAASTPRDSFMPPPPPAAKRPTLGGSSPQGASADAQDPMVIFAAAGLAVLGALFLLILIKRRRNRAVDLGQTQV